MIDPFHMTARGDFRHDAAIGAVAFMLGEHFVRKNLVRAILAAADHRRRRIVAACFYAENDSHEVLFGAKTPGNPVDRRMDANRQGFASARVIVTRPEPDASAFAAMVKAAGMTPVLSPTIEIAFRPAAVSFDGVRALAFTSANGVRALMHTALPAGALALPVFAVGPASADAARQAGFGTVSTAAGDVASLAELIGRSFAGDGAVLHISGSDRAGDLAELLAKSDVEARRALMAKGEAILQEDAVTIQPYWRSLYNHTREGLVGADHHISFELRPAVMHWT